MTQVSNTGLCEQYTTEGSNTGLKWALQV